MGFVFHYISNATEPLHFAQPARALKFYNFVCSIERNARSNPLNDNGADREIISFYVRYHYLRFLKDTTASNALIGAWQKELGHQKLWEDFNLEYESGPPSMSRNERTHSRPTYAPTRKSTGGITTPKPAKGAKPLSRWWSDEDCHCFSDSTLTPLPSDDEEDTTFRIATTQSQKQLLPSSGGVASHFTVGLSTGNSSSCSVGSAGQGTSRNDTSQDVNMDSADEPPSTPPQDVGSLPLDREPTSSAAALTQVFQEIVDDPMNGTSASAACFRSGRKPLQSLTYFSDEKSLSAPVPRTSTTPHRKRRRRANWYSKKKSPKKPKHVEETADQPMVIDTPTLADLEPDRGPLTIEPVRQVVAPSEPFIPEPVSSEPPSLKISIHPSASTLPIVSEIRVPFSTSYANIPSPRPAQASNPDLLPDDPKGSADTPVIVVPGFSRPTLFSNPPIWAQVSISLQLCNTDLDVQLVASGALRILRLLQGIPRRCLL